MGNYSDYLNKNMSFEQLSAERKNQLKVISKLRDNRDIIVYQQKQFLFFRSFKKATCSFPTLFSHDHSFTTAFKQLLHKLTLTLPSSSGS